MISVIIPVYNEEKALSSNSDNFRELSRKTELIFVDGGSPDRTCDIARRYGIVLHSRKGRAAQMNYGAGYARSDVLLFLHADNNISLATLISVENRIKEKGFIGGCLTQEIDNKKIIYRFIEQHGNQRARITKVFYGDQGIFVRKDVFLRIGGFPEVPIMEDVLFTKRLRKLGKTVVLPDKIFVSARRWEKQGITKAILIHNLITILFWFKCPLRKIKLLYDDLR